MDASSRPIGHHSFLTHVFCLVSSYDQVLLPDFGQFTSSLPHLNELANDARCHQRQPILSHSLCTLLPDSAHSYGLMNEPCVLTETTEHSRDPLMLTMGAYSYVIPIVVLIIGHGHACCPSRHFMSADSRFWFSVFARARSCQHVVPCQWFFDSTAVQLAHQPCLPVSRDASWDCVGGGIQSHQHAGLWWVRNPMCSTSWIQSYFESNESLSSHN
jgi:hypothetical protein